MLNSYDIYEKLNGSSNSCKYCLNWAEDDCKMKQVLFAPSGVQERLIFVSLFVWFKLGGLSLHHSGSDLQAALFFSAL